MNLQVIDELCSLIETQSQLIRRLAFALDEAECLAAEEKRAVKEAQDAYTAVFGSDNV